MQPLLAAILLYASPDNSLNIVEDRSRELIPFYLADKITVLSPCTSPRQSGSWHHLLDSISNNSQPGDNWSIYPVPVKDVLHLRYLGKEPIRRVINVVIRHLNGTVFHRLRYSSLSRYIQIPVNNLGSGTYDITIVINNKIEWHQRFVK
jgi:hypothetical protein